MPKRLPEPYRPSNPPIEFRDWHRWIGEELERLRQALEANPVIMFLIGDGTDIVPVGLLPSTVIVGIGDDPIVDYPGAAWDNTTGTFTASLDGIYSLTCKATLAAFGLGNKSYFAQLDLVVNGVPRSSSFDGGSDDVPLGVTLATDAILLAGDECVILLSAVHEQFSGNTTYDYSISYQRVAS